MTNCFVRGSSCCVHYVCEALRKISIGIANQVDMLNRAESTELLTNHVFSGTLGQAGDIYITVVCSADATIWVSVFVVERMLQ